MAYNSFRINIATRVILLTLTVYFFTYLTLNNGGVVGELLVLLLVGLQVISLIIFINKANEELVQFIDSLKEEDFSKFSFDEKEEEPRVLNKEFGFVLQKLREIGTEKEAHYQYLKNIVQHLAIGIMTFNKDGEIQIINTAAKRLFRISHLQNISALNAISPPLVDSISRLKTGGRDLIKIEHEGDLRQLAIYAIELSLKNEEFKLISVQNIQSELEEKEMEAWQNLIRVLTHEIMNSVTPISSLAASVEDELKTQLNNNQEINRISNNDISEIHSAVQVIHKRSKGLISFVSDFRNLTRIPTPKISVVLVKDLFERVTILFRNDLEKNKIHLESNVKPTDLTIKVDQELIEQVLINLVKNAIQALAEHKPKIRTITLNAYPEKKNQVVVKVADSGPGIDEEALEKLFIPFFTTKKNGSGIGLSISRQIMRQHKASITAQSDPESGTEFTLKF